MPYGHVNVYAFVLKEWSSKDRQVRPDNSPAALAEHQILNISFATCKHYSWIKIQKMLPNSFSQILHFVALNTLYIKCCHQLSWRQLYCWWSSKRKSQEDASFSIEFVLKRWIMCQCHYTPSNIIVFEVVKNIRHVEFQLNWLTSCALHGHTQEMNHQRVNCVASNETKKGFSYFHLTLTELRLTMLQWKPQTWKCVNWYTYSTQHAKIRVYFKGKQIVDFSSSRKKWVCQMWPISGKKKIKATKKFRPCKTINFHFSTLLIYACLCLPFIMFVYTCLWSVYRLLW